MNRIFSPTGGTRIGESEYQKIRDSLSIIAEKSGYPSDNAAARTKFDVESAIYLHQEFKVSDNEAAKPGVWNFLACVALPDLVRWRWPADGDTSLDRFLAGNRNSFQRLWWRAKAYYDAKAEDPYWLVREIGEDESVGIMERTALSGTRIFVVAVLKSLLASYENKPPISRSELMRDAMKRFRRLGGIIAFETLTEGELSELCLAVFKESTGFAEAENRSPHEKQVQPVVVGRESNFESKDKTNSSNQASREDLAWLEAEMKQNQGRKGNH